ncbi:hypothetical protein DOTSEDRAFT_89372 [Dothistroma septosporum NZE10]|uniref:Uncharacterized protein n=1 Tax=Dothistroma septosporum (strain NZE10 / CBS 128990) TaxID=675120 RepID=M2YPK5_DOTSN|nr:hypothetical protein DOTSEDRAFT_89372 [Dothistroma septosporum NZE10]
MSATSTARPIWNALIRTHHITSRKKVAKLRQAATKEHVFALLRSGSPPGVMYCEGAMANVEKWVAAVQRLRYKEFQLIARPAVIAKDVMHASEADHKTGLYETDSVKDFAAHMDNRGVLAWWRKGMGYIGSEHRL